MYEDRILSSVLRDKVVDASYAASLIKSDMTIGVSGFTGMGHPKAVPIAIAKAGAAKNLTVISGASTGDELDGELARAGLIGKRYSFQTSRFTRDGINDGDILYRDLHLGAVPEYIYSRRCGELDYAIIECCMIFEDGGFAPTMSVGPSMALADCCDHIILEINTNIPAEMVGMHDIFSKGALPSDVELPIFSRVGLPYIQCDPEKIEAIVVTDIYGENLKFSPPDTTSAAIADNILNLLGREIESGRLARNFTFQSGQGSVANAVLNGFSNAGYRGLKMFTEVIQDGALKLISDGVVEFACATALSLSDDGFQLLLDRLSFFKEHIILRPQDVSNYCGSINSLHVVTMNTAVEADIYGHINSTNVMGSRMINGIGGSNDFAKNGGLRIFMTPSTAKDGNISSIVPMVTHVDTTEHDVDFIVTECGCADLRGKAPRECAPVIIERCAHPDYKPLLYRYFEDACKSCFAKHIPHNLENSFSFHLRYQRTRTMKES